MMARKYVPNGNGAVQYFKDMKHDQFGANALDEDGKITDGQLIIFAKKAFLRCGHKTTSITDISADLINRLVRRAEFVSNDGYQLRDENTPCLPKGDHDNADSTKPLSTV